MKGSARRWSVGVLLLTTALLTAFSVWRDDKLFSATIRSTLGDVCRVQTPLPV